MSQRITSVRNPMVAHVQRLRKRGRRMDAGVTPVEGDRVLEMAIGSGVEVATLFVCRERLTTAGRQQLAHQLYSAAKKIIEVSPEVADRMAYGGQGGGLLALVEIGSRGLPVPEGDGPVIVLDGVEKPGNVGAVLRSADAAGAAAVVCAGPEVDPWNPNLLRASQGAAFTVPFGVAARAEVSAWLRDVATDLVVAAPGADASHTEMDLRGRVAVVLGSEHAGVDVGTWSGGRPCRIDQVGRADSLNVSIAAAVFLFEALRQRRTQGMADKPPLR